VIDSDWLDSDVDGSLVDDLLADVDDCELLIDGVLLDWLDCEVDESLDEPESLDSESLADELDPATLGRLIDALESLDLLVDESLDWESDELSDDSLDADRKSTRLNSSH